MPFDGSGNFNRVFNWATDKANSINITASRVDTEDSGFATGLSNCLTRDGQGKPTAPINWNGQTLSNVASLTLNADPSSGLQAATKQYVDKNIQLSAQNWGGTAGGTANALTVTLTPVPAAYAAGLAVGFVASLANSGAVTLNVNALGAINLVRQDNTALSANDILLGALCLAVYDGVAANFKLVSMVPSQLLGAANTWGQAQTVSLGTAVTHLDYIIAKPTDWAAGKPWLSLTKDAVASTWVLQLWDGSGSAGTIKAACTTFELPALLCDTFADLTEIATPANPASGVARFYAKSGLAALYTKEGTSGAEHLVGPLALASARGLSITNNVSLPNTKVDITVSEAILTDSNGIGVYYSGGTLSADCTVTGANGLDTGALAASTWYFLYLIYNPATNTFASLASLSSTAPTMPSGYTAKMRVGAFVTDSSVHFYHIIQKGSSARFLITAASNTSTFPFAFSDATSAYVSKTVLGVAAPSTAVRSVWSVDIIASSTGGLAPNASYLAANSGSSNPAFVHFLNPAADHTSGYAEIVHETTAAFIWSTSASSSFQVIGWVDAVNAV